MAKNNFEKIPLEDALLNKIMAYYRTIWMDRRQEGIHNAWLSNFKPGDPTNEELEKLNALFLLSKFMYFGNLEMRELLKSLFRDLFKYPIVAAYRRNNRDTHETPLINRHFESELLSSRFLGVGNPSESGVHILYYFRQENNLSKELFINPHEIFKNTITISHDLNGIEIRQQSIALKNPDIKRYYFIDDFCGSGTQAKQYSDDFIELMKKIKPDIEVSYIMIFGTEHGIKEVKDKTKFDKVEAIFTIDETFKCFSDESRYYIKDCEGIDKSFTKDFCTRYGNALFHGHSLGYKDCQLLLSLFHNTPDNTLPIFWSDLNNWKPIFKRYPKVY